MKYIYPFNSNGQPLSKRQTEIRAETKSKEDILDDLYIDKKMLQRIISSALLNFEKQNPLQPNEDFLSDDADQTAMQKHLDRATEAVRKAFVAYYLAMANKAGKNKLKFTEADVQTLAQEEVAGVEEEITGFLYQ